MQAERGGELACRARNHVFDYGDRTVEHGVISYYASRSLPFATTIGAWRELIDKNSAADVRAGRLPAFNQLSLRVLGDPATPLPGRASPKR
jgi:hypothetical protein